MTVFDHQHSRLECNILLEASAGTGKTYALEHIVARLLAAGEMKIEELLILTYTKKAAAELRLRVRRHLRERLAAANAKERLAWQQALNDFSLAYISTFHSFIQRLLKIAPLQLHVNPRLSFEQEEHEQLFSRVLQEELLRRLNPREESCLAAFCERYASVSSPETLIDTLSTGHFAEYLRGSSELKLFPGDQEIKLLEQVQSDFQKQNAGQILEKLAAWEWKESLFSKLKNGGVQVLPKAAKKINAANCSQFFNALVACRSFSTLKEVLSQNFSSYNGWQCFLLLSSQQLLQQNSFEKLEQWKEYQRLQPIDQLIDLLAPFFSQLSDSHILDCAMFLEQLRGRIVPKLKRLQDEKGLLDFDALIDTLYQRVCGQQIDQQLLQFLQSKYKVALIDEFQDTDWRQWSIIKAIFDHKTAIASNKRRHYILVGDPKQSIYGFRGVNPRTYATALETIEQRYLLSKNFRSNQRVVEACNVFFSRIWKNGDQQGLPAFEKVSASGKKETYLYCGSETETAVSWFDCDHLFQEKQGVGIQQLRETVLEQICAQISHLLRGAYRWRDERGEERSLVASDIAVLFSKNDECLKLRELLTKWQIPAVISRQETIFQTLSAELLLVWLRLLQTPNDAGLLKILLLSPFFACSDLTSFDNKSPLELIRQLEQWRQLLDKGDFLLAFEQFCRWQPLAASDIPEKHIEQRLLRQSVRHAVDFQQLFEWLQNQYHEQRLDSLGLLQRLEKVCKAPKVGEEQQRLEAEENTVQLLTAHASKGLQYPIVFVAIGLGGESFTKQKQFSYYLGENRVLDLAASEAGLLQQQREFSAEFRRLFYVALTRARYKIYLPLATLSKRPYRLQSLFCDIFPPAAALENWQPGRDLLFHLLRNTSKHFRSEEHIAQIDQLIKEYPTLFKREIFQKPLALTRSSERQHSYRHARFLAADLSHIPLARSSSFSSITRHLHTENLTHRYDDESSDEQLLAIPDRQESDYDRFSLAGGAQLGDLLHVVLEKLDFRLADCDLSEFCQQKTVRELLEEEALQRFSLAWYERAETVLLQMLWQTLKSPFLPDNGYLALLSNEQCRQESEFLLHIKQAELADFELPPGLLHGFIDLIFYWQDRIYLLDWKSNLAFNQNSQETHWSAEVLERLMQEHHYHLQYSLYLVALSKRLGWTETSYEKQFGGCYYLFLRAMDCNQPKQGVYFARPCWQDLLKFALPFTSPIV